MQIVKKNENRIPHRLTQSVDSEEKDIAMTVWNKHKSLGFLLSKQSYCMYATYVKYELNFSN